MQHEYASRWRFTRDHVGNDVRGGGVNGMMRGAMRIMLEIGNSAWFWPTLVISVAKKYSTK